MTVNVVYANQLKFTIDATTVECQVTDWKLDMSTGSANKIRTACVGGVFTPPDPNADGIGTLTVNGLGDWSATGWSFLLAQKPDQVVAFTLNVDIDVPTQAVTYSGTLTVPKQIRTWGPVPQHQVDTYAFAVQTLTGPTRYVGP